MMRVIWSDRARQNLKSFIAWYRQHDSRVAVAMARDVYNAAAVLRKNIDTGRPSVRPGLREKSIPKWSKLIIYRRGEGVVEIVAILDTRMRPPTEA